MRLTIRGSVADGVAFVVNCGTTYWPNNAQLAEMAANFTAHPTVAAPPPINWWGIINAVVWFAILGLFAPTFALNCLAAIRRRMLD